MRDGEGDARRAAAKMKEKFEVIMAKKEEAAAKRSEPKEEKKAERFGMFMEMQKKKIKLEEQKIAIKLAFEEQKLLSVKVADLDPDAPKFVQD